MSISRRAFLRASLAAGLGWAGGLDAVAAQNSPRLARRFRDLSRHFIFEYYAWYDMNPVAHWDEADRVPPTDLASNFMPRLGAYDSESPKVMEQHAKWIREAGAGAINVSWWGPGSDTDRLVPRLMDVMKAHDIRVTFHLEPYRDRHAHAYADDVTYLIRQYGEKRRWDTFLLLVDEHGRRGPVFKSFRTILPPTETDCRGTVSSIRDYADDGTWREQTDRVRETFRRDFDHVTLLADSLDWTRTRQSGFDGVAIYDNYVRPASWREYAEACSAHDLVFSFNVNPGVDTIVHRRVAADSCYSPPAIEPPPAGAPGAPGAYEWTRPQDLAAAVRASEQRIAESMQTTIALQTDPQLANAKRGFFLVYLNSFNEWHEGHQFEPMKDRRRLTPDERAVGYHNPEDGDGRFQALKKELARAKRL